MDEEDEVETSIAKVSTSGADWISALPAGADKDVRDISMQAVWSLSSCKTGFGVHELLDDSVERYWQSDGPQPHTVAIEFPCKTDISYLFLYLDFKTDESYTPSKVIVYLGSSLMNLDEGLQVNFQEPSQWQVIDLRSQTGRPARAFVIQLQVVQNHQNGRDTHIRHMRVIGPSRSRFDVASRSLVTAQPPDLNDTVPNTLLSKRMNRLMTLR